MMIGYELAQYNDQLPDTIYPPGYQPGIRDVIADILQSVGAALRPRPPLPGAPPERPSILPWLVIGGLIFVLMRK